MNDVLKTIAERYSCRAFNGQAPSSDQLRLIAGAALAAPSGMNRQAWRVIVVRNRRLMDELEAEMVAALAALEDKTLYDRVMGRGGKPFFGAPCLIMVPISAAEPGAPLDCGILAENIALAATSLGLGSLICGIARLAFAGEKGAYFKDQLGFPPGYEFGICVLLGHTDQTGAPHEPDLSKLSFVD